LDDDVYRKLKAEVRRTGVSFKEAVNEHLRRAFASSQPGKRREAFRVAARDMGLKPGIDLSNIQGLLDELDGVDRR